jgi:hypothetical protein
MAGRRIAAVYPRRPAPRQALIAPGPAPWHKGLPATAGGSAMAETKTKPTHVSVDDFLDAVVNLVRRADGKAVREMMERVTGEPATMWGPSIIGFGSYHYRYDSGHEGDAPRVGFSPRSGNLVLYVGGFPEYEALLGRLGKHKSSKACLYLNKLADVDMDVLEEITRRTYEASGESGAGC